MPSSPLDGSVLDWLEATIGLAPTALTPLEASTATVVRLDDLDLVLRWYDDPWFLIDEPEAIVREVAALRALAGTSVPAPRLVAASSEAPAAVLMTRVPGVPDLGMPDGGALRDLLEAIHLVDPGPMAAWTYRGYHEGQVLRRPGWWQDRSLWERAVARSQTKPPNSAGVFIHRDLHPGNILWNERRITGVVDWVNACVGPAAFDVAHERVNLAVLHGPAVVDASVAGDPAWDVEAALGFLDWGAASDLEAWTGPWPHLDRGVVRERFEAFVGRALARLG